jgi:hypothetical protein
MMWAGQEGCNGKNRKVYRVLVGKPEEKTPVGRQSRRWENGIKWILGRLVGRIWSGFTWLSKGSGGGLL